MRRVPLERLLRGPPGCVHSAEDQMAWYPASGVVGFSLARRLTGRSVHALAALVGQLGGRAAELFVLDASRVEPDGCDPSALLALEAQVLAPLAAQAAVRELRVVAGGGLAQAAVVGAVALGWPRAWRTVPSLGLAFQAPERGHPPPWVEPLVSTLANELLPLGVVSRVRAELGASPGASLHEVATALGLGPRSLQRALEEAATTFASERTGIRLELAASRLAGREKLSAIAAEVGYRSLPHFTRVFRSRYGVSPGAFRARRQRWPALREVTETGETG